MATKIKNSGTDVAHYGGEYPVADPLSAQVEKSGAPIPLIGGDAIYSDEYVKLTGARGEGDMAPSVGAPVEDLPSAKEFIARSEADRPRSSSAAA